MRWNRSCSAWCRRVMNFLKMISGWIECGKLITKNVFLWSRRIPCVKWQPFVATQHWTRTWNRCWLTGNVWQSRTVIRFHFLKLTWIFFQFICPCISCICEVSFCTLSLLSLTFCKENSSTHDSWALFISPIPCIFRIWVSPSTFSFIDNSSCRRTCSRRRVERPVVPIFERKFVAEAHWCNQLLRDLPKFDGSAFLKTELLNWFCGSSLPNENNAAGFPGALGSWGELDIKLFLKSAWVGFALAPLTCNNAAGFSGAIGIREDSQSSRLCIFRCEASIFRSSPSSRSESAMLSAES